MDYKISNLHLLNNEDLYFKIDNKFVPDLNNSDRIDNIFRIDDFEIDSRGSKLIVFILRDFHVGINQVLIFQQNSSKFIHLVSPKDEVDGKFHVVKFLLLDVPHLQLTNISDKKLSDYNQLTMLYRNKIVDLEFFNSVSDTNIPFTDNPHINNLILDTLSINDINQLYSVNFVIRSTIKSYCQNRILEEYEIDLDDIVFKDNPRNIASNFFNKFNITIPNIKPINPLYFYMRLLAYNTGPELLDYAISIGNLKLLIYLMLVPNLYVNKNSSVYTNRYNLPTMDGINIAVKKKYYHILYFLNDQYLPPDSDIIFNTVMKNQDYKTIYDSLSKGIPHPIFDLKSYKLLPDHKGADFAADNGDIQMLDYLLQLNIYPTTEGCDMAAINGDVTTLQWIYDNAKILPSIRGPNKAAANGKLDVIIWMEKFFLIPSSNPGLIDAADKGHFNVLDYMAERDTLPVPLAWSHVLHNRDVDMVQWLTTHNIPLDYNRIANLPQAIHRRNYDFYMDYPKNVIIDKSSGVDYPDNPYQYNKDAQILLILSQKYIIDDIEFAYKYNLIDVIYNQNKLGRIFTEKDINWAMTYGRVNILNWIRDVLNKTTYYQIYGGLLSTISSANMAAEQGKLNSLLWFVSTGMKLNKDVLDTATKEGHMHIVKYIIQEYNKADFTNPNPNFDSILPDIETANAAAGNNHMNIVLFLESLQCYPDYKGADTAAGKGHIDMLKYLKLSSTERSNIMMDRMKSISDDQLESLKQNLRRSTIDREKIVKEKMKQYENDPNVSTQMITSLASEELEAYKSEMKELETYIKGDETNIIGIPTIIVPSVKGANEAANHNHLDVLKFIAENGTYPKSSNILFDTIFKDNNFEMLTWLANIPKVASTKTTSHFNSPWSNYQNMISEPIYPDSYNIANYIERVSSSTSEIYVMINFLLSYMPVQEVFDRTVIKKLAELGMIDLLEKVFELSDPEKSPYANLKDKDGNFITRLLQENLFDKDNLKGITHTYQYNAKDLFQSSYANSHYFNVQLSLNWFADKILLYKDDVSLVKFDKGAIGNVVESGDVRLLIKIMKINDIEDAGSYINYNDLDDIEDILDTEDYDIYVILEKFFDKVGSDSIKSLSMLQFLFSYFNIIPRYNNMFFENTTESYAKEDRLELVKYMFVQIDLYLRQYMLKFVGIFVERNNISGLDFILNTIERVNATINVYNYIQIISDNLKNIEVDILRVFYRHNIKVVNSDLVKNTVKNNNFDVLLWETGLKVFDKDMISDEIVDKAINNYLSVDMLKLLASLGKFLSAKGLDEACSLGYLFVLKFMYHEHNERFKIDDGANLAALNGHLHILKWLNDIAEGEGIIIREELEKVGYKRKTSKYGKLYPRDDILNSAIYRGNLHVVSWLIDNGYRVNLYHERDRNNLLTERNLEVVKLLHREGLFQFGQLDANIASELSNSIMINFIYKASGLLPDLEHIRKIKSEGMWNWLMTLYTEGKLNDDVLNEIYRNSDYKNIVKRRYLELEEEKKKESSKSGYNRYSGRDYYDSYSDDFLDSGSDEDEDGDEDSSEDSNDGYFWE